MASSENSGKEEKGSLCSETEQTSVPCSVNTFANDGSFMELFKKRMEAESRKLQGKDHGVGKDEGEERVGDVVEERQDERKAPGSTKTLPLQVWLSDEKSAKIFSFWEMSRECDEIKSRFFIPFSVLIIFNVCYKLYFC